MQKQRLLAIDALRVLAISGVILIHTTTRVLERTSYNLNIYSWTLFLNQIVRFSVPLFFLISGFVLELTYSGKFDLIQYIKKRLSKIFIPYIFWSLIYYYFVYSNNGDGLAHVLFTGNASYQLYFIPALLIFYILFPIVHKLLPIIARPVILIAITLLEFRVLHLDYFVKNLQFTDSIRIAILGFFFFVIGAGASQYKETLLSFAKKWQILLGLLFAYFAYYIFNEGQSQYQLTYNINAFYSSWRPSTLIYTIIGFPLLLVLFEKINLDKLSKLSFLVFFIHVVVLEFVWKYIGSFTTPSFYFEVLFFALVAGISFTIAKVLHKIPHISKVTG